jgi:hypothetical protein
MIARTDKHNHFPTGYYIFLFSYTYILLVHSILPPVGQCKCRPGVIGRRCDSCPNLFAEVTLNGCEGKNIFSVAAHLYAQLFSLSFKTHSCVLHRQMMAGAITTTITPLVSTRSVYI